MDNFFSKLESYDIFNSFLPGIVIITYIKYSSPLSFDFNNIEEIALALFSGVVINRLGSLIIEPIYIKLQLIKKVDYTLFIKAEKQDQKIRILLALCNMYRSLIAMVITIIMFDGIRLIQGHNYIYNIAIELLLLIIFTFSYKKQWGYIVKRIKLATEEKSAN